MRSNCSAPAAASALVVALIIGLGVLTAGTASAQSPRGGGRQSAGAEMSASERELANELSRLIREAKFDEALPIALRALAMVEKSRGGDSPDAATIVGIVATLYTGKGDFARAELFAKRALDLTEKALGQSHNLVGFALGTLALVYLYSGDYARAEPLYKRAIAVLEKSNGTDDPKFASMIVELATLYLKTGDYKRAEPMLRRGLAIQEKALEPDNLKTSISLTNLGNLYREIGDYARAEELHERALSIREKLLGPSNPYVALSLSDLGLILSVKGDFPRAEAKYRRSLAILEKAVGPDHIGLAFVLNNLATLYVVRGDFFGAEPLFQRVLTIQEGALGAGHPDSAITLMNLADVYRRRGDFARAEPMYQRALAIQEKALGPDHKTLAETINGLATLAADTGDYARAESLYKHALTIQEKALGPDHPSVATSLQSLALLSNLKNDFARSEALYKRAVAIQEKALGPQHPELALSLSGLALLRTTKSDYESAEALYKRSLHINEETLGASHPQVAKVLNNMEGVYIVRGRVAEAVSTAERATEIQDRFAATLLAAGSEEQKRLATSALLRYMFSPISLHIQHAPKDPSAARLALTSILRRKGRVLDAMTDSLATLRRSFTSGDRKLLDQLASIYSQLATRISRGPGNTSPAQYRKGLAELEENRQALEAAISKKSAAFRAQQRLVNLADVQAKIPEDAALIEISRYDPFNPRIHEKGEVVGAPRYAAYVLRWSGEPAFADLGEAGPIDVAVANLRKALGDHDRSHDPKPAARTLDRLLMQPIRKLLGETRRVFLSPDGPLHLIPFAALVDQDGHYLVERYLFSYLTTGRDLLRFDETSAAPREGPLVVANPAFNDSSAPSSPEATHRGLRSIDMVQQGLPSLESTVEEANTIARLFPQSRTLLGAAATEAAVKGAHAPALLHMATHGFFLPEQPVPEALLHESIPGSEPSPSERAALLQRENPLLRSGIALAGFNKRRSGSDDGVLTALEATGLDLHGTRLVVLSTCESGVGEASSGEGVYGLRRALTMAGSETQVMSLWQVDTGRTRELMQSYYQRLQGGAGRSEAMRDVQLAMLSDSKTSHPNLWASFLVSGDWRPMGLGSTDVGKVAPSARGCACDQAGSAPVTQSAWLLVALALAAVTRKTARDGRKPRACRG